MNLYLSLGHIWTGTLADAKAAQDGKDFEHVEFPTDKPGLLAILNGFRERFPGMFDVKDGVLGEPVAAERMAAPEPVDGEWQENIPAREEYENGDPTAMHLKSRDAGANPGDCPMCCRSKRIAKVVATASASLNIKADLEDIHDTATLNRIMEAVEARRKFLVDEAYEKLDTASV
jgi:hypothetical protein